MKRLKSLVVVACALMITVTTTRVPASAQSSAALSIVPRKDYTIEAGKSIQDNLTIRNLDDEKPLDLTLRVVDFTFTDEGGSPKLMLAEDAPQTTWSLRPFLTVPQTVSIPPKTSRTLDMSVAIPEGHGAGSYYSAIVYSSGASEGGNVGLSASGVTLVFTSIPGEVNEKLTLEKFGAYDASNPDDGYLFLTTTKPNNMAYTLKNEGNVTQKPIGSMTLKHMFGGQEVIVSDINSSQSLALIGQTRKFITCIKLKSQEVDFNGSRSEAKTCATPTLWPGRYSATLNVFYGQNGNNTQEIIGTASFWYLPVWFILLCLAILVAAGYYIRKFINRSQKTKPYRAKSKKPLRRR